MTNELTRTFDRLRREGRKALVAYLMAGDGGLETTAHIVHAFDRGGADVVELGVPFSDPLADGPVVHEAALRALGAGTTLEKVLDAVARLREHCRPARVLMLYHNLILQHGLARFAKAASRSGVSGIIVPDLPLEESVPLRRVADENGLCLIQLAAPTTPPARLDRLVRASRGFLYLVSYTGVTGSDRTVAYRRLAPMVRRAHRVARLPVCIGFGIHDAASACAAAEAADGVIVGSFFVRMMAEHGRSAPRRIEKACRRFRAALGRAADRAVGHGSAAR